MHHRVFVDANVLASRTLRDWLFQMRNSSRMYQLHASEDVITEALRQWRRRNPRADGKLTRDLNILLRDQLNEVVDDFPGDIPFDGSDGDLHVHAAASRSHAHIVLTSNTVDYGDPDRLPYDLYTPDEFLCLADASDPHVTLEVTRAQVAYWTRKRDEGREVKTLHDALIEAGCPEFAERVRKHVQTLVGPT